MASEPRVGVAVFVFQNTQDGHFVVGRRKGSHGAGTTALNPHLSSVLTFIGTYALPGGHLDFGESFEQCAAREVKEETGLDVQDVRFLTATNTVFGGTGKHYVTIFMTAMVVANLDGSVAEPQALKHTFDAIKLNGDLLNFSQKASRTRQVRRLVLVHFRRATRDAGAEQEALRATS
ncbi:hypothetical protein LTR01_000545 [Friedmanniomyces endolithicus]|nr:hypothetical protein LTR01_000545 [Friedmanniomyces endolithicus]KAK0834971.1 hypothetical protein LTR73_001263 [Friedmanniomyces endolithicus]